MYYFKCHQGKKYNACNFSLVCSPIFIILILFINSIKTKDKYLFHKSALNVSSLVTNYRKCSNNFGIQCMYSEISFIRKARDQKHFWLNEIPYEFSDSGTHSFRVKRSLERWKILGWPVKFWLNELWMNFYQMWNA